MILKLSDTKNKDFCVILSHFYVERQEVHKFNILDHVIDYYNNLGAYIIFSSHGEIEIPHKIQDKIDAIYWEQTIDRNELGRGHPKFCIRAMAMAKERGFKDILFNDNQHADLLSLITDKKMIISEQTNLASEKVGDLFMFGETDYIYKLWTTNKWNYSRDGLYNLYQNFNTLSPDASARSYIKEHCLYLTPQDINWVTVTDAWKEGKIDAHSLRSCFWGKKKGFVYYGGF